jgi:hypothetical protein
MEREGGCLLVVRKVQPNMVGHTVADLPEVDNAEVDSHFAYTEYISLQQNLF